jgi:flagellar FliJ protein
MAKFRYHLQNIMNIKEKMESQARQEFAESRRALDLEEERLRQLYEKKEALDQEAVELLQGTLDFHDIDDNQLARLLNDQAITEQTGRVKQAEMRLEASREKLTEAIQERKTHETLREKAFQEYLVEENRAESKVIDELTTYVHGRKGK